MPLCCGDTKPLCHVAHASVALQGMSIAHISHDKSLVLCQHGSQRTPRACSSRRSRGHPLYLGRAVTTGPHTRRRSLSWGVWICAAPLRHDHPALQERPPHCGTAYMLCLPYTLVACGALVALVCAQVHEPQGTLESLVAHTLADLKHSTRARRSALPLAPFPVACLAHESTAHLAQSEALFQALAQFLHDSLATERVTLAGAV